MNKLGITKKHLNEILNEIIDPLLGIDHIKNMEDLKKWCSTGIYPNSKKFTLTINFPDGTKQKFCTFQEWRKYKPKSETGITKDTLTKIIAEILDPLTGWKHINSMEDVQKWVTIESRLNGKYILTLNFPDGSSSKFYTLQEWRGYNSNSPASSVKSSLASLERMTKDDC